MQCKRITKRVVDALKVTGAEYAVWDAQLPGFGLRVRASGAAAYIVTYRAGSGRKAPVRRLTLGQPGKLTPEKARQIAKRMLGDVAQGKDPAAARAEDRAAPTVAEWADTFMSEHVKPKRKPRTAEHYQDVLDRLVKPEFGTSKIDKLTRGMVARLHGKLSDTPFQANRVLAIIGSMYAFAATRGVVSEGMNPARKIGKYPESRRERFLMTDELERLGAAIREAETTGIPWRANPDGPKAKHIAKEPNRFTKIDPSAAAALRLLLFTGCRLREILGLRWEYVDIERGALFLPESKTGRKTIVLNAPALAVLARLPKADGYVIAGPEQEKPRADLKRPWRAVSDRAGLKGVRLHDLRHTYASFGASGGLGLQIIGKLLGHSQPATTARYAHLDNDPVRRASESIAGRIAAAMGEGDTPAAAEIVPLKAAG